MDVFLKDSFVIFEKDKKRISSFRAFVQGSSDIRLQIISEHLESLFITFWKCHISDLSLVRITSLIDYFPTLLFVLWNKKSSLVRFYGFEGILDKSFVQFLPFRYEDKNYWTLASKKDMYHQIPSQFPITSPLLEHCNDNLEYFSGRICQDDFIVISVGKYSDDSLCEFSDREEWVKDNLKKEDIGAMIGKWEVDGKTNKIKLPHYYQEGIKKAEYYFISSKDKTTVCEFLVIEKNIIPLQFSHDRKYLSVLLESISIKSTSIILPLYSRRIEYNLNIEPRKIQVEITRELGKCYNSGS